MNKEPQKPNGWCDWFVIIAMTSFTILMLVSLYTEAKILKYVALVPALLAVWRTFASSMKG